MPESTHVRALVAEALKQGAGTVDEVQRKIAAMPIDALRRFGFEAAPDTVADVHDQVSRVARDFLSQTPGTEGDRSSTH
jgi:phytoene/squalene synthetase